MSAEHGVDLRHVKGTGSGGRITKQDILAYLEEKPSTAPWEQPATGELFRPSEEVFGEAGSPVVESEMVPGTLLPLDPVRKSIAEHMVRSAHTSPHVSTVMEADMSRVVAHRAENKAIFDREGVHLTYSAYFVAASVQALKAVPIVNSTWTEAGIQLHPNVNVGLAVSLGEKGLIVPVIRDADQLSLLAIAASVNDLANRARAGELKPDEVHDGTFTITNHGTSGSLFATPIINQPQAAILGVGALQKRVVAMEAQTKNGEIGDFFAIRPMAYLSLTFDHRILDGAIGDAFLGTIVSTLEAWR
jgi:2-oxoglutarate dehydrogenase E2 component (dihydrolipoamide succinyltransferase)